MTHMAAAIPFARRMVAVPRLLARSLIADRHARRAGAPGLAFATFGRILGLKALLRLERGALDLLLTPVNIVRYWEFPFVLRHLAKEPGRCLDISSPRLFSFYVVSHRPSAVVRMLNPDLRDADLTRRLSKPLGRQALVIESLPVSAIEDEHERYDSIWSISVIEHIPRDGDTEAIRLMYEALAPGGTLVVTVPVDRRPWDEFRQDDAYALGVEAGPQGSFFQRWYDESAITKRLLLPLGDAGIRLEWFGERVAGRFAEYEKDWIERGRERIVDDPREIADWYATYDAWSDMPGQGVCGIVARKPK